MSKKNLTKAPNTKFEEIRENRPNKDFDEGIEISKDVGNPLDWLTVAEAAVRLDSRPDTILRRRR